MIVDRIEPYDRNVLRRELEARGRPQVLVYVHGFNTTFDQALRQTAALTKNLGFRGLPILYSWPSAGNHLMYSRDTNQIGFTWPHLASVLEWLGTIVGHNAIFVLAHSLGTRAVVQALQGAWQVQPSGGVMLAARSREVILAAPDIDTTEFRNNVFNIRPRTNRVTIYSHSKDLALVLSRWFWGLWGQGLYRRLGQEVTRLDGTDLIDASRTDTTFWSTKHSYYIESPRMKNDLQQLIRDGLPPGDRTELELYPSRDWQYWTFSRFVRP